MIDRMRLTRARSAFVVLLAILHLGGGVLAAFAPCCDEMASGGLMECCLKGGPDHVCPHTIKRARESAAPSDHMTASCAAGHDDGIPVMGFAGIPPGEAIVVVPDAMASRIDAADDAFIDRIGHPPSPPPKI